MKTQRYFLELSYNGTVYHGWQIQPNAVTVQELLNNALSTVFRQKIEATGCGRTDTGVHARQFFAHFDMEIHDQQAEVAELETVNCRLNSLNALLPVDIAVKRFIKVTNAEHARFDAIQRSYEYHIHFSKDPFRHGYSWLIRDRPDIDKMNLAASILLEYTDFSCFSKSNTQVFTNNCKISRSVWTYNEDELIFHISADRFLRNMVRAIVGTLIEIGNGESEPEVIRMILESKDRSQAGVSVPACGLYLTEVVYPFIKGVQHD